MDRVETRNSRALGVGFPLLVLAGLSLLAALWGGLVRLGWNLPLPTQGLPASHGPLMVVGFVATLVGLERAIALKRRWSYLAPVFTGASGLALLAGLPMHLVLILAATGGFSLIIIFVFLYWRQPSGFMGTMGLGAFLWFVGNLLWLVGYTLHDVVPWWIGFLVLTIAGELRVPKPAVGFTGSLEFPYLPTVPTHTCGEG